MFSCLSLFTIVLCYLLAYASENYARKNGIQYNVTKSTRFLIYDVNPGEGFNLRRDVYGRVANLVRRLVDNGEEWILVVPPWRHLYHWKNRYLPQEALPWWKFFDLVSMNHYVPVMEFYEFLQHVDEPNVIDEVVYLQRHKDNYNSGYKELCEVDECKDQAKHSYRKAPNSELYEGYFWGMDIKAKKLTCVGVQGGARILGDYLAKTKSSCISNLLEEIDVEKKTTKLYAYQVLDYQRSILAERFEQLLHVDYGSVDFFKARRSLVFAKHLREEGDKYRKNYLRSNDESDKTPYNEDWRLQIPNPDSAIGGPYVAVHMRRGDFANSRSDTIPSFEEIGLEVEKKLQEYKLKKVYVATDGTQQELEELQSHIKSGKVYQYPRPKETIEMYKDGGIAIIDQWIAAHGRYFIGTCESTFSFRIHEERDILGFREKTTFNCICGKQSPPDKCHPPSKWRVKFS